MKYIFRWMIVCLSANSIFAQRCPELKGTIVDAHDQTVIEGARITLLPEKKVVHTAAGGSFSLGTICDSVVSIEVIPHFGCEPLVLSVDVYTDSNLVIPVETHVTELDEFDVVVYRLNRDSQAENTVNTLDIQKLSGTSLGDQLKQLPGVTSLNTGSSIVKPAINGMHSNRIVVVNNGIRQEGQQWGSEHAPEIDPNLSEELEVIQGASGLQYGPDAIGGVILTKPAELRYFLPAKGWVKSGVWSNGRGGMLSGMINGSLTKSRRLAYRIHATGSGNGTISAPDYYIKNTASNQLSFSGAMGYKGKRFETDIFYSRYQTTLGIFTGSHIGNLTDLEYALTAAQPKDSGYFTYQIGNPKQFIQHQLTKFQFTWNWNEHVKTHIVYGYQYNLRQEYDLHKSYNDSIAALGLPAFELNLWTNSLDVKTSIRHSKRLSSVHGVSGFKQDNAYQGRYFIPNFKKFQGGAFFTLKYVLAKWLLDGGVRYDVSQTQAYYYDQSNQLQTPVKNYQGISGNIGASRTIGHHIVVRLNAGTAWRPPSINELFSNGLHHGAAAIEIGNENMQLERCYNLQSGLQYNSSFGRIEVQAFVNHFNNYIFLQPQQPPALTIVGAFPVFRYQQGDLNLNGANINAEIPFLHYFTAEGKGSYLYAVSTSDGKPVFGIPSNRLSATIQFRTNISKKWLLTYRVGAEHVFKQTRSRDDLDYAPAPPAYTLVSTSLGFTRKSFNDNDLKIVLSVTNATNQSYRDYMNRFRYFTDDQGINVELKVLIPFEFSLKKYQQ